MSVREEDPNDRGVITLTVPPVDVVQDLHGDPLAADLVLFLNGNQFMVMEELLAAFRAEHAEVREIFYETLPPGVLVEQVRRGALRMGELTISVAPDVLTAGPRQLARLRSEGWVGEVLEYASNDLAMLVRSGNPAGIREWRDLGRSGVRVAMPNPDTEGVGKLIVRALEKAGGQGLARGVMEEKVDAGEVRLTQIHHRESALWLERGEVDVAPLWSTEARYHVGRGPSVEAVLVPPDQNERGRYGLAIVEKRSRHPEAAAAFVRFMEGDVARSIYAGYGFSPAAAEAP
ncbi:MAG: molybdate ABC transporter substrate-binding protein [Myxococcaceae bacterium]